MLPRNGSAGVVLAVFLFSTKYFCFLPRNSKDCVNVFLYFKLGQISKVCVTVVNFNFIFVSRREQSQEQDITNDEFALALVLAPVLALMI